jgi:uncharacterized protein (DUF2062 family)
MSTLIASLKTWAQNHAPTRERLERSRFLRPLASRPELWRFTRRSVPRGVAVGLAVAIFFVIPGLHIIIAASLCVPLRANVPLAVGSTLVSNPATIPLFIAGALWIGSRFGFHADLATLHMLHRNGAAMSEWTHWLLSDGAPALLIGLAVLSLIAGAIGYFVTAALWRVRIARRRQARTRRAQIAPR